MTSNSGRQQKVALVTGGAQGIGRAITKKFLEQGFAVAIVDIDAEAGEEILSEFQRIGDVIYVHADVSSENDAKSAVSECIARFGRLDVLVNNAGIAYPYSKKPEELPVEQWNRIISVNLTGAFLFAKFAIPFLKDTKGSIVNISSTRAFQSEPNTEAYTASKSALVGLTHALAMSLAGYVRVNCVCPGWIDVNDMQKSSFKKVFVPSEKDHAQHPVGRIGMPEDVAEMVYFLVSENAGFITGQAFVVDGGMSKKMIYV